MLVKAQELLLESRRTARELTKDDETTTNKRFVCPQHIRDLDSQISALASESDQALSIPDQQSTEAITARNMEAIARAMIHT